MTLAEFWGFSDDSLGLQFGIRSGISWSDGEPFGAEDVAFTINTIRDLGPAVRMGELLAPFVDEAVATSETEVLVAFKEPAPRFMFLATCKGDTGLPILPRHIFEGQDLATFANFDPDAGLPLTTGPWQVTLATSGQIVLDRRDDWWAAEQGIASAMPEVERIVLPRPSLLKKSCVPLSQRIDSRGGSVRPRLGVDHAWTTEIPRSG